MFAGPYSGTSSQECGRDATRRTVHSSFDSETPYSLWSRPVDRHCRIHEPTHWRDLRALSTGVDPAECQVAEERGDPARTGRRLPTPICTRPVRSSDAVHRRTARPFDTA